MKKFKKVFLGVILSIGYCGCQTSKNARYINEFSNYNFIPNNQNNETVRAKVIFFEPTLYSYKILIKDDNNREYLVLTNNVNTLTQIENTESNIFYEFELLRLTNKISKISDTISINGQNILKMPSSNLEDCIYFNNEKFCSSYYQVYELINWVTPQAQ